MIVVILSCQQTAQLAINHHMIACPDEVHNFCAQVLKTASLWLCLFWQTFSLQLTSSILLS